MITQIKQVGLVYLRQRSLWLVAGFIGLVVIPNILAGMTSDRGESPTLLFSLGMPMLSLLPFLVGQVKMQFGHSRARLIPGFMVPHLGVLVGILLVAFVLYPIALARLSSTEPLGLMALGLAVGAPVIWGAHFNRFWPMLIALGVFYSLLTQWGMDWWVANAAAHQVAHAAIVVGGLALVAAWLRRLAHLNEEMDDYQNVYLAMLARRTGSEAVEQRRVVASTFGRNKFMARVGDWWHESLGGYYGGSQAGLRRLLRYGYGPIPIEVQGLFMLAMFVALGVFMSRFSLISSSGGNFGALWFFMMFGILMPGQIAGETLAQRRPRVASELLLPLSRRQLINGLFSAAARNSVVLWLIMTAGLGIVVAAVAASISLQDAVMFTLISASTTFAAMAVGLRFATWPSMSKRMLMCWLGWMVLIGPVLAGWAHRDKIGDAPLLLLAAVLMAVGAGMLHHARKVWLNLELG
jgi:hypothetical protein